MTKAISDYRTQMQTAIAARASFETAKNAANTSMQKTLTDFAKSVDHDTLAEIMIACNVDATFINRAERVNARFNVYAAEKVANVVRYLASVASLNHYTLAIIKTAIALESEKQIMTQKDACNACSASLKSSDAKREKIVKSARYSKHTSANTATTQSSSSLNALIQCNVLSEARDAENNATFTLIRSSEATKRLAAKLEIAI
jgi:hypothetical protein